MNQTPKPQWAVNLWANAAGDHYVTYCEEIAEIEGWSPLVVKLRRAWAIIRMEFFGLFWSFK